MAEHGHLGSLTRRRQVQQRIVTDGRAQHRSVVAELPDLRGGLVDEAQVPLRRDPDGARGEQRILGPVGQERRDVLIGEVEPVTVDQEHQAGGVATAHLEPVDRAERGLDRREGVDGRLGGGRPSEVRHRLRGAEPIALDRPHGVLEADECGVDRLQRRTRSGVFVQGALALGEGQRDLGAGRVEGRRQGPVRQQGGDAWRAAQQSVDRLHPVRHAGNGSIEGRGRGGAQLIGRSFEE